MSDRTLPQQIYQTDIDMRDYVGHTPGPYELDEFGNIYATSVGGVQQKSDRFLIAQVRGHGHLSYNENGAQEEAANARMFRDAPILVDIANRYLEKYVRLCELVARHVEGENVQEKLRWVRDYFRENCTPAPEDEGHE